MLYILPGWQPYSLVFMTNGAQERGAEMAYPLANEVTTNEMRELHAALHSAWLEVMRRYVSDQSMETLGLEESQNVLLSLCAMMGSIVGNIIANVAHDPTERLRLIDTVKLNIPIAIEAVDGAKATGPKAN
jgi:hypothetical protein